ncbi:Alpha-L-fucosidase [Botrimarina colliarenosi]|uniref:alpha-L-fucosidase n=1 Tax=Botrimarina colliarenosi TaxID=2528001 RepID=A0A5C6ACF1_9BACT|nr:alpha-L-fucosidase [Botrimarina colliarenosi]TWT97694.1 Alpha-L-fucosidase [Botrimarina colliarenosi]
MRGSVLVTALAIIGVLACQCCAGDDDEVFLFTSFEEPADAGLRFVWSRDGLEWSRVPGVFLKPWAGAGKLMRDPSLARGPDGVFHLVWTTAWRGDQGFGYAHSDDLVHWSPQRFVPVMEHEPTTVNVWAPEISYDAPRDRFLIVWASTIPGRFPDHLEPHHNNQRLYYTATRDFVEFTPAKLFCEPGFSVIDSVIVPTEEEGGPAYRLVVKDNTRKVLALRTAEGDSPTGPWRNFSEPLTGFKTEGPTVARVGDEWLLYFDAYGEKQYGALATTDFREFHAAKASFPKGHKHGTVLKVTQKELDYLLRVGGEQAPGIGQPFVSPLSEGEIAGRLAEIDRVAAAGPFQPDWESLRQFATPAWYADAKFGLFIHWGAYSVPAFGSEWYPRNMYVEGSKEYEHHLANYGPAAEFGYKDFIPQFKAEKFDPSAWAALFREAGVRYVVPVAEHHDGFPMFDSELTEWTAAKKGPRRDVLGDLAAACRDEGIVVGASSHRAENWWFFGPGRKFESDVQDSRNATLYGPAHDKRVAENQSEPPSKAFLDDWLLRSCEMVDKFQPRVVYFDWWICQPVFQPYLQRFAAYYYNSAAEAGYEPAINFKEWEGHSFPRGTGVLDVERGKFGATQPQLWQTCTSVSKNSWGYVADHEYKQSGEIIDDLIDVVSKNGVLLLNIGPKADGTIPEPEQQMLREIGGWLAVNGDAIYGTRPWKHFGEGPTREKAGSFTDGKRPEFTSQDLRFTARDGKVYGVALAWPEDGRLLIESFGTAAGEITSVRLLGFDDEVAWRQTESGLAVELPQVPPTDFAHAIEVIGLN